MVNDKVDNIKKEPIRKPRLTVAKLTPLIEETRGNLSLVARKLNVTRGAIYKAVNKSAELQNALLEAREQMIDNVESTLYTKALDGDTTAMIFFLKTQGKKRGYVERQELTGADGNTITVKLLGDDGNEN